MKIVNKTRINTKQIGWLIRVIAVKEYLTPEQIAKLRVTIIYRKRTHARPDNAPGGYAYYNSTTFCLKFVRGVQPDVVATAKTIGHEIAHCRGLHHRDMNNTRYGWKPGWHDTWAWAAEYKLEMLPEPGSVKLTVSENIEKCQTALERWKSKQKMANTKIKKWNARLKYYEKRQAAMSRPQEAKQIETTVVPAVENLGPVKEEVHA